jgi:hypothetical protein
MAQAAPSSSWVLYIQQFSIKQTKRNFLKGLQSNPFKKFLGLGLSAKRCNIAVAFTFVYEGKTLSLLCYWFFEAE